MKISIVTATYNSGGTLRDTMLSVLAQRYDDFEHIIVDGGSTDNTMAVVRELEPRYRGRLRYVSERDHGIYDAMNKGIAMATGDIVGILNSDDFYTSENVLSTIAERFKSGKTVAIDVSDNGGTHTPDNEGGQIDAVYGDIHFVKDDNLEKCVRYYSSKSFRPWKMRFGFMPAHPSFYCRREVYQKYGLFDIGFKIGADFENLTRLIFINRIRTSYIPMDFVTMRMGGASTAGIKSHNQISRDIVKALRKNGVRSNRFIISLRFPFKIFEVVKSKIFN